MKFKDMHYPMLIAPTHIPELCIVEESDSGLVFGASVTLSHMDTVLKEATEKLPGWWHGLSFVGSNAFPKFDLI